VGVVLIDCDPDLSRSGPSPAPGLRSTLVLLALLLAAAYLAAGGFALGLAIPSGVVAALTAWALARRVVRLVRGSFPSPIRSSSRLSGAGI
jgi:hypothetical protein